MGSELDKERQQQSKYREVNPISFKWTTILYFTATDASIHTFTEKQS
jgi:hypothetical protein